ncbi:MAG TPA: arginyltransferase [Vicinamibacteria bacterium]|nr:arginyltransferase [Vicinamibacteria bacterium]
MTGRERLARAQDVYRDGFARALDEARPEPGEGFPCPYLPGRKARQLTVLPAPIVPGTYHALMDLNFRRLGRVFYRPACEGCAECRILRVPVEELALTRSQRRCLARNRDVEMEVSRPDPTTEKWGLYRRYLEARHDGAMDGSWEEFSSFLYTSGVDTREVAYRVEGRLLAVCLVDCEPLAWSAVYCFFDPDEPRRSLGVFNVLSLAEQCRTRGVPWLYLGYYVPGCRAMAYKAGFEPCETLGAHGVFRRLTGEAPRP